MGLIDEQMRLNRAVDTIESIDSQILVLKLTDWERRFIRSMRQRLDPHTNKNRAVSEAQDVVFVNMRRRLGIV